MTAADRQALLITPATIALGALLALAGSHGGQAVAGVPLFAAAVGAAFVIQWLAFIPAWLRQTERFFDLTGSITYLTVIALALSLTASLDARSALLAGAVVVWALRLGTFLFTRIHRAGRDDRFDEIKPSFPRFLSVWTIQGLWVAFTVAAALAAITTANRKPLDAFAWAGALLWAAGFLVETIADEQKRRFRANPANRGQFIRSGLWSRSRHPNYFGEIVLWAGVAIIAAPVLRGWQWITMLSPVFVTLLLTRVSGIPLLERKAEATWGGDADYQEYRRRTPILVPRLTRLPGTS